jgi:hypothetical protein
MKLVETKISETAVHMRYADNPDSAKATAWIDFQVPLKDLMLPDGERELPLGDLDLQYLGLVRQAALRYVHKLIGEENIRLGGHVRRNA